MKNIAVLLSDEHSVKREINHTVHNTNHPDKSISLRKLTVYTCDVIS